MTVTEEHRLNAGAIRRDYLDGLNATQDEPVEERCEGFHGCHSWPARKDADGSA